MFPKEHEAWQKAEEQARAEKAAQNAAAPSQSKGVKAFISKAPFFKEKPDAEDPNRYEQSGMPSFGGQDASASGSSDSDPSNFFTRPAESLQASMNKIDREHKRRTKTAIRVLCVVLVIGVGCLGLSFAFGHMNGGGSTQQNENTPVSESSNQQSAPTPAPSTDKQVSEAGSAVYQYKVESADGGSYTVTETVEFGDDGMCTTSEVKGSFADEATAAAFMEAVERDFSATLMSSELDKTTVTVTVDISKAKMDREAYEDILRKQVEDLYVVKK